MWISKEKYDEIQNKLFQQRIENERLQSQIKLLDEKYSRLLDHLGLCEWTENEKVEPKKTTLITKKLYNRRMRAKQKESPQYTPQQQMALRTAQQQQATSWFNTLISHALTSYGIRY